MPLPIPLFEDVVARCYECRKPHERPEPTTKALPASCTSCGERTHLCALPSVAVGRSPDGHRWLVKVLDEDDHEYRAFALEAPSTLTVVCRACQELAEGYDLMLENDDTVYETHFPTRCASCGGGTVAIALEPSIVTCSEDGREWFLLRLGKEDVELVRHRIDFDADSWMS